jgi:hypothetical protein
MCPEQSWELECDTDPPYRPSYNYGAYAYCKPPTFWSDYATGNLDNYAFGTWQAQNVPVVTDFTNTQVMQKQVFEYPEFLRPDLPRCEIDSGCPIIQAVQNMMSSNNAQGITNDYASQDDMFTCNDVKRYPNIDRLFQGQTCIAKCPTTGDGAGGTIEGVWTCSYGKFVGASYCVVPGFFTRINDVLRADMTAEFDVSWVNLWDLRVALPAAFPEDYRWEWQISQYSYDGITLDDDPKKIKK